MKENTGIKLNTKLTSVNTLLIVLTVVVSIFVTLYYGNQIAGNTITKKLESSQLIQQEFIEQKKRQLELVSLVVASDPAFVAYVAQTILDFENQGDQADVASIYDLLLERKQQYGFDVAIIVSTEGIQISRSDQAMAPQRDLSAVELIDQAITELIPVSGFWQDGDVVYESAVVPLARGRSLIGFLITGLVLNDEFTADIAKLTGTEVSVVSHNEGDYRRIGSTLDINKSAVFLEKLQSEKNNSSISSNQQFVLSLNDTKMAHVADSLTNNLYMINGISINDTLSPFLKTRNLLLAIGVGMIVLAFLLGSFLVKKALAPLQQISAATKQVSLGDYEAKFPSKVGNDLNELSGSIDQLVSDIRGRDALSKHMVEISKKSHLTKTSKTKELIEPGKIIGHRFKIIESLGVGGMGAVFKAIDNDLDEVVALKVLKSQQTSESEINQFKDEIRLARRISHPNVVRIHDFGQIADKVFISMEYVQGYTLEQIIKHAKKLRPFAAKHALIHICEGLIAAHESGVIHRDLKPANIIVELDSSIKLMDFGIASIDTVISKKQTTQLVGGTAAYISPEQAMGKGSDERTDVYALGILMLEMFVGKRPFYASSDENLLLKHVNEQPPSITDFWADAPEKLDQIILRCLSKRAHERYQTVQALLADIKLIRFT